MVRGGSVEGHERHCSLAFAVLLDAIREDSVTSFSALGLPSSFWLQW